MTDEWTHDAPEETGFYWWTCGGNTPCVVHVQTSLNGKGKREFDSASFPGRGEQDFHCCGNCFWFGPLRISDYPASNSKTVTT